MAGGGAIELVADEGDILISNEFISFNLTETSILRLSYYLERVERVQVPL